MVTLCESRLFLWMGVLPRVPAGVGGEQAASVAVLAGGDRRAVREDPQLDFGAVPPEPQSRVGAGLVKERVVRAVGVAGELALHG